MFGSAVADTAVLEVTDVLTNIHRVTVILMHVPCIFFIVL